MEVAPNAVPPVCRIMDYGKFKFDAAQKAKESRRRTTQVTLKQMNYRIKIGRGDFDTKTRKVMEFLREGHKVRVMVWFRGRETNHPHLGMRILDDVADRVAEVGKVEAAPRLDGRNMIMVLSPNKRPQAPRAARPGKPEGAPDQDAAPNGAAATTEDEAGGQEPATDEPTTAEPTTQE